MIAGGPLISPVAGGANGLVRFDGQSWRILGAGISGEVNNAVNALGLDQDAVCAGGGFSAGLVRWDGANWGTFNGALAGRRRYEVTGLDSLQDSTYVTGTFLTAAGASAPGIAGYANSNWFTLGAGLPASGRCVAARGLEVWAGHDQGIARWDGASWSVPGAGLGGAVCAIAFSGKDVYAGGSFTNSGTLPLSYIARWDGTNWTPLGLGVNAPVRGLAVYGRELYVGGDFTEAGGSPAQRVARWNGSAWFNLGTGLSAGIGLGTQPDESTASAYALATTPDGSLYVVGDFQRAGEQVAAFIAKWDGVAWSGLGSGLNYFGRTLLTQGADLYVGGDFSWAGNKGSYRIGRWRITDPLISLAATAPRSLRPGTDCTYTLAAHNPGTNPVLNCRLRLALPEGVTFRSATGDGACSEGVVNWALGDLPAGARQTLGLVTRCDASVGFLVLDDYSVTAANGRSFGGRPVYTTILQNTPLAPQLLAGGQPGLAGFKLQAQGSPGMRVALQTSPDLQHWFWLGTNVFQASTMELIDSNPPATSSSFYRLLVLPAQ